MANKTVVIVGAGPGLGLGIARRFGREKFNVGLICRSGDKGRQYTEALAKESITAASWVGDVSDEASIARAFREIEQRFGAVEVLEYSPVNIPSDPAGFAGLDVTSMTPSRVQKEFGVMALGAVTSVSQVLPGMLARNSGAIFITTGISAQVYLPMVGAWGMAGAAARNYALTLGAAVRDRGIFVSTICIGVKIQKGDALGDPDTLADLYYALYRDRDRTDILIAPPPAK